MSMSSGILQPELRKVNTGKFAHEFRATTLDYSARHYEVIKARQWDQIFSRQLKVSNKYDNIKLSVHGLISDVNNCSWAVFMRWMYSRLYRLLYCKWCKPLRLDHRHLISPISKREAQLLMTSQIRSSIEYLIPNDNINTWTAVFLIGPPCRTGDGHLLAGHAHRFVDDQRIIARWSPREIIGV